MSFDVDSAAMEFFRQHNFRVVHFSQWPELYKQVYSAGFSKCREVLLAESRWISVEEELPPMGETVMFSEVDSGLGHQYWFGNRCIGDVLQYYKGDSCLFDKAFTHWQPLPAPPIAKLKGGSCE